MSVICEYVTAVYFAYCRIFRIFQQKCAYRLFFRIIGIFDGNFNIIFVSITYFY